MNIFLFSELVFLFVTFFICLISVGYLYAYIKIARGR
jgi:hypothetical protein